MHEAKPDGFMFFAHFGKKMVGIARFDGGLCPTSVSSADRRSSSARQLQEKIIVMPTSGGRTKDKIKKALCKSCLQKRFLVFYQMILKAIHGILAKKWSG